MSVLIFATNNYNKIQEIRSILNDDMQIVGLREAGIITDIPEPHPTLEENAREKSTFIFKLTNSNCFSEDTGLEVFSLNGEPGVKSARYAGDENDNQKNIEKLLHKMTLINDRTAQFRTVISLIVNGEEIQFEGICKGTITETQIGIKGFGYDSIFIPEGSDKTFAEMEMKDKNIFSHRKKATSKLIDFLNKHHGKNQN
jgi:XTP/dITP diphosphohydrolase